MSDGKWATKTGIELSKEQFDMLESFKKELKIPDNASQDSGVQDDTTLFRFLSGKKWDQAEAIQQYNAMVKWREDMEVDRIFEWAEENKDKIANIRKMYPSERYGYDKFGRPLVIHRLGQIPAAEFADRVDRADFKKFHIWKFEKLMKLCREQSKKLKKPIFNLTVIVDAEGLSMAHRHFRPYFSSSASIDKQNYPELLNSVTVVNSPWILPTLYNFVKHLIDPNTRNKIGFFADDYKEVLLEKVDEKELPKAFGGGNEKPIPVPTVTSADKDGLESQYVSMMDAWELYKHCEDEKGGKYVWHFKLESYDINFSVDWQEKGSEEWKSIVNEEKVTKHQGEFTAKGPGQLRLTFDNKYSYLTSKTVKYALALHLEGANVDQFGVSTRIKATGNEETKNE
mmetsp:Transcript_17526/g.42786  ORF Transcript_17526/g.42786 Transcript_17526/m.42786 type:complete len:398 (+) Transcript_17526:252-1445(+)